MSWRTAEAPRVWRLKETRLRLEGQVCPHCGQAMLAKRPICPQCGEKIHEQATRVDQQLSHVIISRLSQPT